ncbi:DNA processing protein [Pontibacter ummariensis]|uniref:DNA processing protein n=1 Tax=Pontibacter ummariensis TaxID=1610492 RepID=A0A239BTL2_9BACT|nr:DNA-processing protein DprA [Pontibacter ummariensis]PRY15627.1 DNA processing protein [Pontibacter ummariensis]SNS11246.1 DNA processing protein [Pontibacter ummariensis]
MVEEQNLYEVALTKLPGVGPQLTRLLVSYCGAPKAVFDAPPGKLLKIPGVGNGLVRNIRDGARGALLQAEEILKQAAAQEVQILFYTSPKYPDRLKQQVDAPTLLYFRGNGNLNQKRIISIVGTRQVTNYGQTVTERIVEDLKPYHVVVVSGLAYGVDIVAHRAALQAGLPTIGVMASGPETIYPAVHRKYAERMLTQGGLLTENSFGTKPDAPRFPARNRIIAGMSDCTIVVEAALKSGTLITADIAHSYDKEVMAVPGNITSPVSEGTNYLIRSLKAAAYTSGKDLVELLNWDLEDEAAAKAKAKTSAYDPANFDPDEQKVMQVLLKSREEHMDNLSWKAQVPVSLLASVLLGLEFKGVVKALPGKRFVLV